MIQDFLRRMAGLLADGTLGLLNQYKRATIGLVRIEGAVLYLKFVRFVRQELLIFALILIGTIVFMSVCTVLQIAILLYAPWGVPARILLAVFVALLCWLPPLGVVLYFFSQKRWMQITRAEELFTGAMSGRNGDGAA